MPCLHNNMLIGSCLLHARFLGALSSLVGGFVEQRTRIISAKVFIRGFVRRVLLWWYNIYKVLDFYDDNSQLPEQAASTLLHSYNMTIAADFLIVAVIQYVSV